ncbi:methyltransferase family protein [Bdellovibrio sp. HCB337]|uniref:methyltransferase family protein n=1 Tax=Bdellovibrio sp. HCB337 TaxID=3394358 RepID=UPI0039A5F654
MTFYLYTANYARLRKNDVYADEKKVVDKMPLARKITKFAFTFSTLFVLLSFWVPEGTVGFYQTPLTLRFCGLLLTFVAFLFLRSALNQLGKNYSPLFDTHKPQFIVREGLYSHIRHPVYLCNMMIILGYVLSSSSLWVLISSLWGWGYMVRSILREDQYLASEFPEYAEYQKKTWRILPFIF